MAYEYLIYERQENVALITLNRPDKLNALNPELRQEMLAACQEARNDDGVRAVIFTGAGRGFCSGVDLSGRSMEDPHGTGNLEVVPQNDQIEEYNWTGRQALGVYNLDKPTIAAVNGIAVGAGMSLAMSCDLRVGSPNTRFRTIFIERNLSPDSGLSFLLPRVIGYGRAIELLLTSRDVDADEALSMGLLNRLVEHEKLIEESVALANLITRWPPIAARATKRVVQQNLQKDLEDALRNESLHLLYARRAVNDTKEMLAARAEKRTPHFTGT